MNKLAPIALTLFLFFGGALWYLASSELNANIEARIIEVAQYYTGQKVQIDRIDLDLNQGLGNIYGIKLYNPVNYRTKYMLTIEQLSFTFETQSLNNKAINIDEIKLDGNKLFIEFNRRDDNIKNNNLEILYQLINDKIALIEDRRRQKSEPFIQSKKITLINNQIYTGKNNHSSTEDIERRAEILLKPIGGESGLPASLFGIEVLRKSLAALSEIKLKNK